MNRDQMIARIENTRKKWDLIVIGGGATGLGVALEAVSRGYDTLLLEQLDFAQGTSSRSTKLIHGGVRYLQQGNISLVLEALHERGLLLQNAPHLVRQQNFIVPNYEWWEGPFYGIGLKFYDLLAGKHGFCKSEHLSQKETVKKIPTVEPEGLRGGVIYCDGQFDDARLAVTLARTIDDLGGCLLNYMKVVGLIRSNRMIKGVTVVDQETGREFRIRSRGVINATGIFVDSIRRMDDPKSPTIIAPSQGIHLVLDESFLPGQNAILVPHTDDGRVLFAVPWHDRVIIGTTDTPLDHPVIEPHPLPEEIDFLLSHAARYLIKDPTAEDVLSVFAGIRPLIDSGSAANTLSLSRDHQIIISPSGLVTTAGGKWTTYRKMGEDTVNQAAVIAGLEKKPSTTMNLRLHGWQIWTPAQGALSVYGSDAEEIIRLNIPGMEPDKDIHDELPYRYGEIIWAVRYEMARTVEDVLSRRTRALLMNARASMEIAPRIADIMAQELKRTAGWKKKQVTAYRKLASNYIIAK